MYTPLIAHSHGDPAGGVKHSLENPPVPLRDLVGPAPPPRPAPHAYRTVRPYQYVSHPQLRTRLDT
eukprot:SAG31_NODE_17684_length_661_cov_1.195730_1_plen_65_part_01